jgi:type I restriction enzyme, S subunit
VIADLNPYAEYKASGLPWLGQVPGHWAVQRLKQCTERFWSGGTPQSGSDKFYCDPPGGIPWLMISDLTRQRRIFRTKKHITEKGRASRNLEILPRGTILYSMYASLGTAAILEIDAAVNQAIIGISPKSSIVNREFVLYSLANLKESLLWLASSSTQANLNAEKVKSLPLLVPTLAEQTAIVRFLDWANGRLDRSIRAKRKVIALLNEQKQAIIHRAVTRGFDSSVPVKPSGIPWLGNIPHHWEVRRAKYLYREVDERSTDGSEELLSVSHLTGVTPRSQKNITMFKAASYAGHKLCRPGDLVVNTMWAWMGALGVSTHAGIISPAYAVYRPRHPESVIGTYMDGLLRSGPYISNIICRSTGLRASRLRLYPEEFFRLPIIQPPVQEQKQIIEATQVEASGLNSTMARVEREIDLIREYRTRLVADVVTGKLDVREAAARLPAERAPDTAEDDIDLGIDPEAADNESAE